MTVTGYQRVELDGKTYDVTWYGEKALVYVLTKTGRRTLNGYGHAHTPELASRAIAKAKEEMNNG